MPGYFQLLTCYVKENQNPWNTVLSLSLLALFFPSLISQVNSLYRLQLLQNPTAAHSLATSRSHYSSSERLPWVPHKTYKDYLRFPTFRWVQLPHHSNLSRSVTPLHIMLQSNSFHPIPRMYRSFFFFFLHFFSFCIWYFCVWQVRICCWWAVSPLGFGQNLELA